MSRPTDGFVWPPSPTRIGTIMSDLTTLQNRMPALGGIILPTTTDPQSDEFTGAVIDPAWTQVNISTTDLTVDQSVLTMTPPASATNAVRSIVKTIANPSGAWECRARIWMDCTSATAQVFGLTARENATNKSVVFGVANLVGGASIWAGNYTDLTTFGAAQGTLRALDNYSSLLTPVEVRLRRSGTNLVGEYRYQGGKWIQIFSIAEAGVFTTRADRFGLGITQTANSATQYGQCDYFRRIS